MTLSSKTRRYTALFPIVIAVLVATLGTACEPSETDAFTPVTSVYDCVARERPFSIVTQTADSALHIFIPEPFAARTMLLERVEAASGEKYEGEGVTAWTKGDEAMFLIDTVKVSECDNNAEAALWEAAKLGGADFRGFGDDPNWVLEIREREQLKLTVGQAALVEAIAIDIANKQESLETVFQASTDEGDLTVTLSGKICLVGSDTTRYATTVLIDYMDKRYSGCGKALH
jgi:membrane-bound inhibitor of C-type lysozyme